MASFFSKLANAFKSNTAAVATASTSKAVSRNVAKERLSVILASQRGSELLSGVDMNELQKDVLQVVKRHIQLAQNTPVNCQLRNEGEVDLFEMTVEIPKNVRVGGNVSRRGRGSVNTTINLQTSAST